MNETYEQLCERCEYLNEQLGEIESQYRAEVAHYGDAWPGAAIQVAELRKAVQEAEEEVKLYRARHADLFAHLSEFMDFDF